MAVLIIYRFDVIPIQIMSIVFLNLIESNWIYDDTGFLLAWISKMATYTHNTEFTGSKQKVPPSYNHTIFARKISMAVLFPPINRRNAFVRNPGESFSLPCIIDIKSNIIEWMKYIPST